MSESPKHFRPLTRTEEAIFGVLLEAPFPGRDEIRQQLTASLVRTINGEGSLEFRVSSDVRAPVTARIPVQAEMKDEDGVPVRILLHIVGGILRELEVYKGDGSRLIKRLTPSGMRLVNPDEDIQLDSLPR